MTNEQKVIRSLNLSMRDWPADIFNGMSEYDEHTGLTRHQWSDGIQTNIRVGRISNYPEYIILNTSKRLNYGMFRLVRTERYINIAKDHSNFEISNEAINKKINSHYLEIVRYIYHTTWNHWHSDYLKIISEDEYQAMQKTAEKLDKELPNYVTKVSLDDCKDEPKVGDYVRLTTGQIKRIKSIKHDLIYDIVYITKGKDEFTEHAIKKIIDLPEEFKIDCKGKTKKVQKILFELGCDWNGPSNLILYPYKRLYIIDKLIKTYLIKHDFVESKYPELTLSEFYEHVGLDVPENKSIQNSLLM